MKEFIDKLTKKLYENVKSKSCPDEACWAHLNKNCDNCDSKEIKVQEVIRIANELAEEYGKDTNVFTIDAGELFNDGWIPYATDCKMPNEASRVWLSFTTPIASFVKSAWYINGHFEWDNCRRVKETPMAWKPYNVPAPYQPKGE